MRGRQGGLVSAEIGYTERMIADHTDSDSQINRPTVGLALSGGGTRGYAHIGVLQVLEDANIPIDAIAGTSAGGMIGGLYAAGFSPEEMAAEIKKLNTIRGIIGSVVPSRNSDIGFFGQLRFDHRFRENLGNFIAPDMTFDDLRLPFATNALCLTSAEEKIFTSGLLMDAIQATVSVPGMFASAEIDGNRYVDGGVINNIPTNAAKQLGADFIIAVDLSNAGNSPMSEPSLLRPRPMIDVRRTVDIMVTKFTQQMLEDFPADVLIRPNLPPRSSPISDFIQIKKIIAAGALATQQAIPQIKVALGQFQAN